MSLGVHEYLLNIRGVPFSPCVIRWAIKVCQLVVTLVVVVFPLCIVVIVPVVAVAIIVIPIVAIAIITVIPIILTCSSAISTVGKVVAAKLSSSAEVCIPSRCAFEIVSSALIFHEQITEILLCVPLEWKVKA